MHRVPAIHNGPVVTGATEVCGRTVDVVNSTAGVLAVVTDPALREEVDRVGAAVGVRVVHAGPLGARAISRKIWGAAAAAVLDEQAATQCAALPRRAHVVVVTTAAVQPATLRAALAAGAQALLTLPAEAEMLVRELSEASDAAEAAEAARSAGGSARPGQVVAVLGGRGGAGASVFATALAHTAGAALLVDLDPCGGGIDLLLGTEDVAGLRWPDLTVRGGRLDWPAVRAALPRQRGVSVLSGVRRAHPMPAAEAVIDAGRRGGVTVVCDVPRGWTDAGEAALGAADLVVVISPCDVRSCAATGSIAAAVSAVNASAGLVVRGPSPGGLRAAEFAGGTGLPLLATMRAEPRIAEQLEHGGLRVRPRSPLGAAARRVLEVLATRGARV